MTTDTAWITARALTWYFGSQRFDRFFGVCFPDHENPPEGYEDSYKREWHSLWGPGQIGMIFSRLDFGRQRLLLADVMRLYELEAARALEISKELWAESEVAGRRPSPAPTPGTPEA